MIFKIFGDNRVILISDAMRAMGMEDGTYELGGQDVFKKGNRATLADGTLAGSATHLFDCVRTAVSFGIPLESAIKAATRNPAKSIGRRQHRRFQRRKRSRHFACGQRFKSCKSYLM